MKKKLSDDDIIARGPVPEKHGLLGILTVTLIAAVPFIFGAGFAIGGLVGAGLSLWAGAGAAEFVASAAMGMMWGGILSVAGVFGVGVALGYADERYEKKAQAINGAYAEALKLQSAAKQPAAASQPVPAALPTGAAEDFASASKTVASPAQAALRKPPQVIPPRAA